MANVSFDITVDQRARIREVLMQNAGKIYSKAIQAVVPKMIKRADLIVKTAIDEYYDSYKPWVYDRTESLYKVMDIELTPSGFNLSFGGGNVGLASSSSHLGRHRVDEVNGDYIYEVMFKKGYHGGAPYNGDYYWRWPSPGVTRETPPYIMWYPYGPAVQTESPWERIQFEWGEYCEGEGKKLLLKSFENEIKKAIKEVS